jgi:hypothetical protein
MMVEPISPTFVLAVIGILLLALFVSNIANARKRRKR